MTQVLRTYVETLCFLSAQFQALPTQAKLALEFLAGNYAVPTGLALAILVYWFEGPTVADRFANQRAVLRGLVAALIAWIATGLGGLAWWQGLTGPGQALAGSVCWRGLPSVSAAAAVGFALGMTLWRRNWRWGLAIFLATGLWTGAQVACGLRYPLDIVAGTVVGTGLAWLLGSADWLGRRLDALIRLARRLMLA